MDGKYQTNWENRLLKLSMTGTNGDEEMITVGNHLNILQNCADNHKTLSALEGGYRMQY
jgi:hypothetical protein